MTRLRILKSTLLCLLTLAWLLSNESVVAQQIPALEDVPRALPDPPRTSLMQRHTDLAARRAVLFGRIDDFNQRCRLYYSNSPEAKECPSAKGPLYADRDAYIAALKSFNWDLEQAIGDYQNKLEKRLAELDAGLQRDAEALRRMGFSRRAEDFAEWAKFSTDAHRQAFLKFMDIVIDEGADYAVKWSAAQIGAAHASRFGADQANELLRKMQAQGINNPHAEAYLRKIVDQNLTKDGAQLTNELADALHQDLRVLRDLMTVDKNNSNAEKALKLVQMIAPPHLAKVATLGELGIWVVADVGAQRIAAANVRRLTELTEKDLKTLTTISCVSQRRLVEKHEVGAKLAELHERPFDQPKPFISKGCSEGR